MEKRKINITHHARKRLSERVPEIHPREQNAVVSAARYNGKSIAELKQEEPQIANYILHHFKRNKSTKIKFYRGCVFVFRGNGHKARTLITVVNLQFLTRNEQIQKGETI